MLSLFSRNSNIPRAVSTGGPPEACYLVKMAVIQELKLSFNSKTQNIQNFTTIRNDRRQGQGGGLLTLIHKSKTYSGSLNHRIFW